MTFCLLVLRLQQVAGFDAFEAGLATLPTTIVTFLLSQRFGALADRYGPRLFMGVGPLICAAGVLLLVAMVGERPSLIADVVPGVVVFAVGLSMTTAPLTAAILADADEANAGIASGVNNAVARVASLLATAGIGTVIGGTLDLDGFRMGLLFAAGLTAAGGIIGLALIRDPQRVVRAEHCPGGQIAGQPKAAWEDTRAVPGRPAAEAAASRATSSTSARAKTTPRGPRRSTRGRTAACRPCGCAARSPTPPSSPVRHRQRGAAHRPRRAELPSPSAQSTQPAHEPSPSDTAGWPAIARARRCACG